jgi:serine O-acetyltransferase
MEITIGLDKLVELSKLQISNNFGSLNKYEIDLLEGCIIGALPFLERCFNSNRNKYYRNSDGYLVFNPYHSAQYTIFLYYLSHLSWKKDPDCDLPAKIYYLNKLMNGCDLFYEIELPDIFYLDHPVGSVLGRASYSNYFVFQQNCTVGNNKGIYPTFGEFVWLHANTSVIGNSNIGNNVFISAGTFIKDTDISDNTVVFGKSPDLILKHKQPEYFYSRSPFTIHGVNNRK